MVEIVGPIVVGLIFLLLFTSFGSIRPGLLIVLDISFAPVGGVVSLAPSGWNLSVAASVGFIALLGVAVLNGIVMLSYSQQLRRTGSSFEDAIVQGSAPRLRPMLMAAFVGALGLIPLLLARGPGSEIQRPLAALVVGGLASSARLTSFVLPVLYRSVE